MVTIKQGENKFFVGEDAEPIAEITFKHTNDTTITVDHTYVSDTLRGQGVAGQLVEKVIFYARNDGKKIIPECSYAKYFLDRHPEYQDVLAQ